MVEYLVARRRIIGGYVFLCGTAGVVLWLFGLEPWKWAYCAVVTAALGTALFGGPDFVRHRRRLREFQLLRNNAPELPQPTELSLADTSQETLLLETIELLRRRQAELEQSLTGRQEELLEYFTLWAHQIKTPLAAIRLLAQSGEVGQETSEALRQELFKAERYVDLVLGYLRIYSMSADLRLERCAVRPIAARAAKKFAVQFIYKGLRLELGDFSNQVVTDEKWLGFVLEQLISNAVKYTAVGAIRITMDQADVLTVEDQGTGIDPADLPRIFERGFTGRNGRQEETSTGLGLYLTRRVMDKLGNQIEVLSMPGEGTRVRLYLGREEAAKNTSPAILPLSDD